jgi:hypothetical protein
MEQSKALTFQVDCLVFVYTEYSNRPAWVREMEMQANPLCRFSYLYKFGYNQFLKTLDPFFLEAAGYDLISVSLDDVVLVAPHSNLDLARFYEIMIRKQLAVASPSIVGDAHYQLLPPSTEIPANQTGRLVKCIDVQFLTISLEMWKCWIQLIDLQFPHGWQDMFVQNYCVDSGRVKNGRWGVVDTMFITHNPLHLGSTHDSDGGKSIENYILGQISDWSAFRNTILVRTAPDFIGIF